MFGRKERTIARNPRKLRITDEKEAVDGEIVDVVWSKKRMAIALGVVGTILLFGIVGLRYFWPNSNNARDVLSSQTSVENEPTPKIPTKKDIESVIQNAQESLKKITEENITSSQAAIQKVIQDLQSIQSGSQSSNNLFCQVVCGGK